MTFLTESEIERMTGYRQPAAQIRWLQKWRIRHTVSRSGRPNVTAAALEGRERVRSEPNFEALRESCG